MEIDLDAIRQRDGDWKGDDQDTFGHAAARDRRVLLEYIDELQQIAEDIATSLGLIKKIHRANVAKALEQTLPPGRQNRNLRRRARYKHRRDNGASRQKSRS